MKTLRWLLAISVLAALSPALAQDDAAEGSADVEPERRGGYSALDADGDGALNQGEFGTGLFDMVAGDDLVVSPEEYEVFLTRIQVPEAPTDFEGADVNQDGALTADQEFIPAVGMKLFEKWDQDGDDSLSTEEYRSEWFGLMDANGNGRITAEEYEPYAEWFGAVYDTLAGTGEGAEDGVAGGGAGDDAEAGEDAGAGDDAEADGDGDAAADGEVEGDADAEGIGMDAFMQGW